MIQLVLVLCAALVSGQRRPQTPTFRDWNVKYVPPINATVVKTITNLLGVIMQAKPTNNQVPELRQYNTIILTKTIYYEPQFLKMKLVRVISPNSIVRDLCLSCNTTDKDNIKTLKIAYPFIRNGTRCWFWSPYMLDNRACYDKKTKIWSPKTSQSQDCGSLSDYSNDNKFLTYRQEWIKQQTGPNTYDTVPQMTAVQVPQLRQVLPEIRSDIKGVPVCQTLQRIQNSNQFVMTNIPQSKQLYVTEVQPKYDLLDLRCPCETGCIVAFVTNIQVLMIDGVVIRSTVPLKESSMFVQTFNDALEAIQVNWDQQQCIRTGIETLNTTCIKVKYRQYYDTPNFTAPTTYQWQVYEFEHSLVMIHDGFERISPTAYNCKVRKTYVDAGHRAQPAPTNSIVQDNDGSTLAFLGFNGIEPIYGEDPVFLSNTITLKPTRNSCRDFSGYRYNNSLEVVSKDSVADCETVTLPELETCIAAGLEPTISVYSVPHKIDLKPVNCDPMCQDQAQCTTQEKATALYAVCRSLVQSIAQILDTEPLPSTKLDFRTEENNVTKITLSFTQEVASTLTQRTINSKQLATPKLNQLKAWYQMTKELVKNEKFFPDRKDVDKFLGLFPNAMFNSASDLDYMAGLPWAVSWRLGRQINMLSYTASILLDGVEAMVNDLNYNTKLVQQALDLINRQVTNNYKAVTNVYENLRASVKVLQDNFRMFNIRLDILDYQSARVALLNKYYTDLRTLQDSLANQQLLFQQQVASCQDKLQSCSKGQGPYLAHVVLNTPTHRVLIVKHMKPNATRCNEQSVDNFQCVEGKSAKLAPWGCAFVDGVLKNSIDGGSCDLPPVFVDSCKLYSNDMVIYGMSNMYQQLLLKGGGLNLTEIEFKSKINDIGKFSTVLNDTIQDMRHIKSLEETINEDDALTLKKILAKINAWTIWDMIKYTMALLVVVAVLSLLVSVAKTALSVAAKVKLAKKQ